MERTWGNGDSIQEEVNQQGKFHCGRKRGQGVVAEVMEMEEGKLFYVAEAGTFGQVCSEIGVSERGFNANILIVCSCSTERPGHLS